MFIASILTLTAGVPAADHAAVKTAAKPCNDSGLHDSLADPEIYKHVEVTKQLVTLLGVAKTDQVGQKVTC